MKNILPALCALIILWLSLPLRADRYSDYIEAFAPMAVAQAEKYGIPASITIAQGLLESGAGYSRLATEGNNHFGIKCHSGWTGKTMLRDDDAPDECFRVYDSPSDSFEDHSRFLSRGRYLPLFELDPGDYTGWARGLKKHGYATDPNYADKLIAIIERYSLFDYDNGLPAAASGADYILQHLRSTHIIRRSRGLHYVVAVPGDTYATIAREFGLDPVTLATFNDSDNPSAEIRAWEEVYLQSKHPDAPEGLRRATIGEGESMHSVAQRYAMSLGTIRRLNPKAKDRPGTRLKMR